MANHIPGLHGSSETARLQHRVLALMPLREKLQLPLGLPVRIDGLL